MSFWNDGLPFYCYRMVKNTTDLVVRALTKPNSHHEISSMEPFFTHLNNLKDFYSLRIFVFLKLVAYSLIVNI